MIDLDALSAQYLDDPYPAYDAFRAAGRLLWVEQTGRWLVTGHQQALTLMRHEKMSSDRGRWDDYQLPAGLDRPPGGMFVMDPPAHTRLRALVSQAFTQRVVSALRPRIVEVVDQLLEAVGDHDEIDLMAAFACPLPAIVLAELLGVPPADHEIFRHWTAVLIESIDPVSHVLVSEEGTQAHADLERYLTGVIAERRRDPQEDLISGLVTAGGPGNQLADAELLEMCVLLVVAGMETTANLIGNGVAALLEHPDQMDRLRAEPGLIDTAVEELLRYDAPIQLSGRVPVEDVELDGLTLRKGQMVGILLGAANRDPAAFPEPGRLDLGRSPNNHLGFGRGIHFCLGAPLARLEGAAAISALIGRFGQLRLAGDPKRRPNVHVRGFATLPLALR